AEDGIRDDLVTGVQTCALPIYPLAGEIITVGTLTGGITVNAPAATGTTFFAGQEMTFIFTQDGTGGRQIIWNAIYKTNVQAMNEIGRASCRERVSHLGAMGWRE